MATRNDIRLLGLRIRELRKAKRLSQEALAEKAKIHYKFLGGIERGQTNPTIHVLDDIANALGVSLADLFVFDSFVADTKQLRKELLEVVRKSDLERLRALRRFARSVQP